MPPVWWRHWCQAHPGPRSWKIAGWLKVEMTIKKKVGSFKKQFFGTKDLCLMPDASLCKTSEVSWFWCAPKSQLPRQRFQPMARSGKLWTISSDRLQLSIPGAQETGDGEFPSSRGPLSYLFGSPPYKRTATKSNQLSIVGVQLLFSGFWIRYQSSGGNVARGFSSWTIIFSV